jgi:hypothetical protein
MNLLNRIHNLVFRKAADNSLGTTASPLFIISGTTRQSGFPLTIAYLGVDQSHLKHWIKIIFQDADSRFLGTFAENSILKRLKNSFPECSMVLIESLNPEKMTDIDNAFLIPRFINTVIDVSLPLQVLNKKSKTISRIRRWVAMQNLNYEITQSEADQHDFYYNMYLPFIRGRHAESALIIPFEGIFTNVVRFEILLIKKEGETIAGGVIRFWDGKPSFGFLGVKEEHINDVKRWHTGALYYFVIQEFHKRGYSKVRIGGSPSVLTNGLMDFKIRLTAKIDIDQPYQKEGFVSLRLLKNSKGVRDFLEFNPFVFLNDDGKMAAAVWKFSGNKNGTEVLENQINQAFRLGLDECHVFVRRRNIGIEKRFNGFQNKKIVFHRTGGWFNSWF